jgi:hypothetical protein
VTYRDERQAALSRLVALELELTARRSLSLALRRYREALAEERERLEHAVLWYRNGERFGWQRARGRDDLSPTEPPALRLPGAAHLARAYEPLDGNELVQRAAQVEAALARGDWQIGRLRFSCDELRSANLALRRAVQAYAARYPAHPPPPAVKLGPELALGVTASVGGLWVALMLLTALIS